jgi:ElaB/YqjD/DUF883 family membrane-anchored ribosome-binding protein
VGGTGHLAYNFLRGKFIMLSSKVQEIKQSTEEVAEDISAKTKAAAADISAETKDVLGDVGDRISKEGVEIKGEVETLLSKIYDLLRPDASYDLRQQVRNSFDTVSKRVGAWAEGRGEELGAALNTTQLRTRRVIYERPMTSLVIAAGAGALIAYWLTHRSTTITETSE